MKVLISAYACGPDEGSEPGAGWAFVRAAAEKHEVWVVTRRRFEESIERRRAADPVLRERLHVTYHDLADPLLKAKKRPRDVYWYYALWQRDLGKIALRLHREVGFDVAHHVTFAADWLPCGLRRLRDVPLVWGPVGGATRPPWRLAQRWLGTRGVVGELIRTPFTELARRIWGDPVARQAGLTVALNDDVARRFRRAARRIVVEPNSAIDLSDVPPASPDREDSKRAVFVGRLVGWKGVRLAVATIAHPDAAGWSLDFYGSGPERGALEAEVARLGLGDRVRFLGMRPRDEVLAALRDADAMLFPSLHDSAPWAVAEAATLGCPVVCLDLGGPPLLAGAAGRVVVPTGDVIGKLARALDIKDRPEPTLRWSPERLPGVVDDWYQSVV